MNQLKIFTIPEGDWEALYVNGELELEQHRIRSRDIGCYTPIELLEEYYIDNFDSDEDYFPETIEKFPKHWDIEMFY